MKHSIQVALSLALVVLVLSSTACSGGSSSSVAPSEVADMSSGTTAPSAVPPSPDPAASSATSFAEQASTPPASAEKPELQPEEEKKAEAVETAGGTVAALTGLVTGEISQTISGISGYRAGSASERDTLVAAVSQLKPSTVSLVVIGDPLSGYSDQTLLSDEDTKALIALISAFPAPAVFETLSNPTTGGFLWTLYLEAGDQAVSLSDDGFWLRASIKGNPQSLVFDSRPCKAASEKLSTFLSTHLGTAQGNILTLS